MVQAVWLRSSQLLGWGGSGCVASQLLVLVGPGSSQLCGWDLVSCLDGSGCVAGV